MSCSRADRAESVMLLGTVDILVTDVYCLYVYLYLAYRNCGKTPVVESQCNFTVSIKHQNTTIQHSEKLCKTDDPKTFTLTCSG